MKIGIIGDKDAGKTTTAKALNNLVGGSVITWDTPGAEVSNWLKPNNKLDGLILVISAPDGPMPYTKKHVELAAKANVQPLAIWINKEDIFDKGPEILELIEMETRDLLSAYDLKDERIPTITGSALKAINEKEKHITSGHWTTKLNTDFHDPRNRQITSLKIFNNELFSCSPDNLHSTSSKPWN